MEVEARNDAKSFYEDNIWRIDTDLWIYFGALEPQSLESFNTVLYNLTIVLHDVYNKCQYYKYSKLEEPILSLMSVLVDEMSKKIKDTENEVDTMVDKNLQFYNPENRPIIREYLNKIDNPIITEEDYQRSGKILQLSSVPSTPIILPTPSAPPTIIPQPNAPVMIDPKDVTIYMDGAQ